MKQATPKTVWQMQDTAGNLMSYLHPQHGTFWKWGVLFDNGDKGVFNVKDGFQPKFIVGQMASYTIEPSKGDHPHRVAHIDPQYSEAETPRQTKAFTPPTTQTAPTKPTRPRMDPEESRLVIRQTCIKAAAVFCAGRTPVDWESTSDDMFNWVMKPEQQEAKEIVNHVVNGEPTHPDGTPIDSDPPPF